MFTSRIVPGPVGCRSRRIGLALVVTMMAGVLGSLLVATPAHAEPGDGWTQYDGGAVLTPARSTGFHELDLDYFASGSPPVVWSPGADPVVRLCTTQANRPSWVTAGRIGAAVRRAVAVWAPADAAIGIDYLGDCSSSGTWSSGNRVNEIGWDDDSRDAVYGSAVAVTRGSWQLSFGGRYFTETDIILSERFQLSDRCLDSVVAHEVGHALGLGHSNVEGDLMYPSFNSNDERTCPEAAASAELAVVQSLYGRDSAPQASITGPVSAEARTLVSLQATAVDPDGGTPSFRWLQTAGPSVAFEQVGSTISFTTPDAPGSSLTFQLIATDRYLHSSSTTTTIVIEQATQPISLSPSLALIGSGGGSMNLTWSEASQAASYEVCSTQLSGAKTCSRIGAPSAGVTWDTVLSGTTSDASRVLDTVRELTMSACNKVGCGPAGAGPWAGGVRWSAYGIDYDYFAMAFDVPGTSVRFTIGGVVNVSGHPRKFSLYSGTSADPRISRFHSCGVVPAGGICIGLLGPSGTGHRSTVTVVSSSTGTPELSHPIRVR